jgi:serine protease DegQ
LTPEIAQALRLPVSQGVLITGVLRDGPAAAGGMQPGDVVQRIGETPVINTTQLLAAVAGLKPQTQATIALQRGNRPLEVAVTIGQRPAQGRVRE